MPGHLAASCFSSSTCLCLLPNFGPSSESPAPSPPPPPIFPTILSLRASCLWSSVVWGQCQGRGRCHPSLCQPPGQVGREDSLEGRGIWKARQRKPSAGTIWCPGSWCQELRSHQCQGQEEEAEGDTREKGRQAWSWMCARKGVFKTGRLKVGVLHPVFFLSPEGWIKSSRASRRGSPSLSPLRFFHGAWEISLGKGSSPCFNFPCSAGQGRRR